ncbi:MAG: 3-mercaptopyruvate sulfurtransferase, partial [Gammaproteobacteria bacterium]|nr:3-mercaptopyruvate sulfurtransferase [Gammaproteobacteria bacterium]
MPNTLVSVDWLHDHFNDPNVIVLDASYHLPTVKRDPDAEFIEQHIPGALRFDIEEISDHEASLPHMLPTAEQFDEAMQDLGVGAGMQVVVYDSVGLFSAARAWWMFRYFGHDEVAVLDGGLPAWIEAGHPVESGRGKVVPPPHPFKSRVHPHWVVDADDLLQNIDSKEHLVLDARANPRFKGEAAEPRPGMRAGHIPGSANVPFSDLLDSETGRFKSVDEVRSRFADAGVDHLPVVVSCGSGVTACVLALGLEIAGLPEPKLYDG